MTTLEGSIKCAERRLFDLAAALRGVPVDEGTRDLHLRALELKRDLAAWQRQPPDVDECRAVLAELDELSAQARACRERARRVRPPPWSVQRPGIRRQLCQTLRT